MQRAVELQDTKPSRAHDSPAASAEVPTTVSSSAEETSIAIVGVACRLPGGVTSAEGFWTLLAKGGDGVTTLPAARWRWPDSIDVRGKHKGIDQGGFLPRIDEFDAAFFRTSPREAELMDPQQRLLLECHVL